METIIKNKDLLVLDKVSKFYKSKETVSVGMEDISLTFNFGEFVAVTGTSGSGKSTLLNVISGLDGYEEGEMFLFGEETSHYKIDDWERYRAAHIGFIFQNYNIVDSYTVLQNVMLALEIQNYPANKRKARALELIDKVGLTSHKNHKASKLSGGQKQRTVIARALAKDSPIIVADEPTGNLDSESGKAVMKLLHDISEDKLVIVVTHDYQQVEDYATRRIVLQDGHVIEDKHIKKAAITYKKELAPAKQMSFLATLKFAWKNLLSQPKRLIFILLLQIIIAGVLTTVYIGQVKSIREEGLGAATFFESVPSTRMLIQRRDNAPFTSADEDYFNSLKDVKGVYLTGENFKNNQTLYLSDGTMYGRMNVVSFIDTVKYLSNLEIQGTRALNIDEIVVSNSMGFKIGERVTLSPIGYKNFGDGYYDENDSQEINDEYFTITGITTSTEGTIYFSEEYLKNTQAKPIVNTNILSQVKRDFRDYSMLYVNVMLGSSGYYDFQVFSTTSKYAQDFPGLLYKVGSPGQFPEGSIMELEFYAYIPIESTGWGFAMKEISISYEVNLEVDIAEIFKEDLSMSAFQLTPELEVIIEELFLEEVITVITTYPEPVISISVDGYPAGTRLLNSINSQDYRIYYPANITSQLRPIMQFLKIIWAFILITILGGFLYTILHAVTKNVMEARKKDFAIYRSIGANKNTLGKMVIYEQIIISLVSLVFVLLVFNIGSIFNLYLRGITQYLQISDYLLLMFIFMLFGIMVGTRFNKKVFNHTVIETLSLAKEDI